MNVILTQNVPHLGSLGDEVVVKDGYARNYLLPRGLALAPTSHNAREIDHRRRSLEKSRAEAMEAARSESEKLTDLVLTVKAKSGANGRLFGSVTNRDLQAILAEMGYEFDRRSISLHEPIKSIGNFTASIKLHSEVKVDIGVKVESILDTADGQTPEGEDAEGDAAEGESATGEANAEGESATGEARAEGDAVASGEAAETATVDAAAAAPGEPADAPPAGSGGAPPEEDSGGETAEPDPTSQS